MGPLNVDVEQQELGEGASSSHGNYGTIQYADSPTDSTSDALIPSNDADTTFGTGYRNRGRRFLQGRWIPTPVVNLTRATSTWIKGPQPPRLFTIESFLPRIQQAPLRLIDRWCPKRRHKMTLLLAFYFCWLLTFSAVVHHSALSSEIEGHDQPTQISCLATYWSAGNSCGLNGDDCRPFSNSSFTFRCPANCGGVQVLNPRAVGAEEVIYQSLVIGGPESVDDGANDATYRGDSFICGSAIHAGIISNQDGGCGVVELVGERDSFIASSRHGISSVAFDSSFPIAFTFLPNIPSECKDLRWPLLVVSIIFTCIISLFTSSGGLFFSSIFVGIFFHVGLGSDPPNLPDYYSILSTIIGRFLPASFVAFVLCRYCIKRQLDGLEAQIEKTILWLGGCWIGALTNYTFDFIPIQRLTPHDLDQQPGAKTALAIIVIVIFLIVIGQIWALRQEGRLPRFLALYILFGVSLLLFIAIPGLSLRIHHYILALLLIPGTAIQTRPALLYQGLLMGLFINGIARWGFDSILQTSGALQGDGQYNSLLPSLLPPAPNANNITLSWDAPSQPWDGVSVLVNDVERHRSFIGYDENHFTWQRAPDDSKRYYFRLALLQGSSSGDYTRAGIWDSDGSWLEMLPGPSKSKRDVYG
jgi:hypothetical protein